jgi:hypothetical protein
MRILVCGISAAAIVACLMFRIPLSEQGGVDSQVVESDISDVAVPLAGPHHGDLQRLPGEWRPRPRPRPAQSTSAGQEAPPPGPEPGGGAGESSKLPWAIGAGLALAVSLPLTFLLFRRERKRTKANGDHHRLSHRVPFDPPLKIVATNDGGTYFDAWVLDLSLGGAAIRSPYEPRRFEVMKLAIPGIEPISAYALYHRDHVLHVSFTRLTDEQTQGLSDLRAAMLAADGH